MTVPAPQKASIFKNVFETLSPVQVDEDALERKSFIVALPKEAFEITTKDGVVRQSCTELLAVTSSDENMVASSSIAIADVEGGCEVSFIPNSNASGNLFFTLIYLLDPSDSLTIPITINGLNDPPVVSDLGSLIIGEDATTSVLIPIADDTPNLTCAEAIAPISSNENVISSFTIVGSPPNCELAFTPMPEISGTSTISLIVSDGEFNVSKTFDVTVNSINDTPVILDIVNQNIPEDSAVNQIAIDVSDIDSDLDCATISVSSSNTNFIANNSISISGLAPQCFLSFIPASNQTGTSTITVAISDGNSTATKSFVLTIDPVNDPPTMSPIASQSSMMDAPLNGVAVTLTDPDSILSCSSLSATSSNQTLIANTRISFSGTAPNCFVNLSPEPGQTGSATITLTLTDGVLAANQSFTFSVNATNNPPTISPVSDQSTNEDTILSGVGVTISDTETSLSCASLSATSSNTTLVPSSNILVSGSVPNCIISMTPALNQSGTSTITLTVTDTQLTASDTFVLTVNAVNDAPTISNITDQTTSEDTALGGLAVTIADAESALSCASLSAASSNATVIPQSNILFSGTAPNCTVSLTPSLNQSGTSTITLSVTDSLLTVSDTFNFTVSAINDSPTISNVIDQSTNEDTTLNGVAVTIADIDSVLTCAAITPSTSDSLLIPASSINIAGTAPNCLINMAPSPNKYGSSTITLTVNDGVAVASDTFIFTVNSINDAPVMSNVLDHVTPEDTNLTGIALNISDVETALSCSNVTVSSSDTTLLPLGNISVTGTAPNCTINLIPAFNKSGSTTIGLSISDGVLVGTDSFLLTVTAVNDAPVISDVTNQIINENTNLTGIAVTISDTESTLTCASLTASSSNPTLIPNSSVVISGTAPNCLISLSPVLNQNGSSTITLTVTDAVLTASDIFVVSVNPINGTPTISNVTDKTTTEDTPLTNIAVVIGDYDSPLTCGSLTSASSNTALIPNSSIVVSGTAPNCLVSLTPALNQSGSSTITLTVSDTLLTATDTFIFTVSAVNDAPTISNVTDKATAEDTALSGVAVTIGDIDSALTCASLTAASSNAALIPSASIVVSGTAPNCLVRLTPALNQSGSSTITLTVSDTIVTATDTFILTVTAVNDAPTISNVTDKTTTEDTALTGIAVTVADAESALTCASLTAASSNTTLIPNASIVMSGTAPNCLISLTPALNQSGSSTITLTVSDTLLTATDTFILTVTAVNDAPTILNVADVTFPEDTGLIGVAVNIADAETALTCASLTAVSSNTSLIPNASIVASGTAPNCIITLTPTVNQSGSSTITLTVSDTLLTGTDTFILNISPVNDAPTISNVTDKTTAEDTSLTGVAVTIGDIDSALTCASLTATSSNTVVIANASIVVSGTAPNCLVRLTPALNQSGSSTITLRVSDTLLSATDTFILTVTAVNDAPTISDVTDKSTTLGTPLTGIAVTISDVDSALTCTSIAATSSNTVLIASAGIAFSGTAPNCLMSLTPSANQSGTSTITLTISDGAIGSPLSASDSFIFTSMASWVQEAYIKASNANSGDFFGESVAISGNTSVIGAYGEDSSQVVVTNGTLSSANNNSSMAGASYVYKRTGSTWVQEAYLKAPNTDISDYFGIRVAISGDTAIVGAVNEDSNQTDITNMPGSITDNNSAASSGSSYIYLRTGATWDLQAYIKASNADPNDSFGWSVAISGNRVIVGSANESSIQTTITNGLSSSGDNTSLNSGASYLFVKNGSIWSQEAYIKASNSNATDTFGCAVSISGDTAVVGAEAEDSSQTTVTNGTIASTDNTLNYAGASYVYRKTGALWAQEAYIKASNTNAGDIFGSSIDISGDTVIIGAYSEDSAQTTITNGIGSSADNTVIDAGASYIFKRTGSIWNQEAYLKASNANAGDAYGVSVAISGDTALVGADQEDSNQKTISNGNVASQDNSAVASGASYVYKRTGSIWAQEAYLKASNATANNNFGASIGLSGDTIVVGAYLENSAQTFITNGTGSSLDGTATQAGAAFFYRNTYRLFDPDLYVSSKSANSVTLSWSSNLGSATRVKIAPAVLGNAIPLSCTDPSAIALAAGVTTYTYSGLVTGTQYGFRVCAFDGTNVSEGAIIRVSTN